MTSRLRPSTPRARLICCGQVRCPPRNRQRPSLMRVASPPPPPLLPPVSKWAATAEAGVEQRGVWWWAQQQS